MIMLASYFPITDPTLIFFVVLLIILFAPIVMSKLRIPHIIGMVLAGVMIGQYGFNILERDNSFELFGRVGLYYIMFLAGLEMDMEGVKKNTRSFVVFGLLTCFVPFILTYAMATTVLSYSPAASFLLGCIMASNTLIAYPIVGRYGLQRHPSVMLSVGSSMISLFIALLLLAALTGSFNKDGGWWFWPLFLMKFASVFKNFTCIIIKDNHINILVDESNKVNNLFEFCNIRTDSIHVNHVRRTDIQIINLIAFSKIAIRRFSIFIPNLCIL